MSNRLNYIEQELAKKRGRSIDSPDQVETELKRVEDELYKIPEHLKVSCCNYVIIALVLDFKWKNLNESALELSLWICDRRPGGPKRNLLI